MAYDNNMSGMIAPNERKQQPNHPDFTGQCEIDGKQMWISAWVKQGKPGSKMEGKEFFSLSFKPKDAQQQAQAAGASATPPKSYAQPVAAAKAPPAQHAKPAPQENLDEDVPF